MTDWSICESDLDILRRKQEAEKERIAALPAFLYGIEPIREGWRVTRYTTDTDIVCTVENVDLMVAILQAGLKDDR